MGKEVLLQLYLHELVNLRERLQDIALSDSDNMKVIYESHLRFSAVVCDIHHFLLAANLKDASKCCRFQGSDHAVIKSE